MKLLGLCIMTIAAASQSFGKIVTQAVPYKDGDVALEGFLAYDDAAAGKRPGVLVVHEWWGLNDFAKEKARQLAELGYVALAVDMYGKGKVAETPDEAGKLAGQFRDNPALMRQRAKAAYDTLAANSRVDATKIGAIGFCFGGTTVVQMAASGLNLAGVVSFHGGLGPIPEEDAQKIKAKVLILHGAADTLVPEENIKGLLDVLSTAGVDWQMVMYAGAKHSFTNPASGKLNMPGVGYDEKAAKRSWQAMRDFFGEVLGPATR